MKQKTNDEKSVRKNIECPLCKSHGSVSCFEEMVLDVDYSQDNFRAHAEQYYICEKCGLVYLYPRPSESDLNKYYTSIPVSQTSDTVLEQYKKAEYERTVNFVLTNTSLNSGTIVDVGAATGNLLYCLGKRAENSRLIGIESSKECCNFAQRQYNIEMIEGQLENINFDRCGLMDAADIVLCCHTLEHAIDPELFLSKLSLIVKPSGFLYIEVPSTLILATLSAPRYGRNIHHLHLNHFLSYNLISACEKFGFSPVVVIDDTGSNYPSLKALFIRQSHSARANDLFLRQAGLLGETNDHACNLVRTILNESGKKILLWGAGQDLFYLLRQNNGIFSPDRVVLVDKNPQKQGKDFFGLKVENPQEVDWSHISHILITPSSQMLQLHIREDIIKMGLENIPFSFLFPVNEPKLKPER